MVDQPTTIDEYISAFPQDVQDVLSEIRRRIRAIAPAARETISHRIPAMTVDGRHLVYFAAWRSHISMYPVPTSDATFAQEIEPYLSGKGTVRFPYREPMPYDLISRLVTLLAEQRAGPGGAG